MNVKIIQTLGVGIGIMALLGIGCRHDSRHDSPIHIYSVVDATNTERLRRMQQRQSQVLAGLGKEDRLSLYRLDRECLEVYSPDQPLPPGQENIVKMLRARLLPGRVRGTQPNLAWAKLAEDIRRENKPSVILFETDGDQDNQSPKALNETRKAIQKLSALPQIRFVALIGANPEQRERNRHELLPFGNRAHVLEPETKGFELRKIVEKELAAQGGKR